MLDLHFKFILGDDDAYLSNVDKLIVREWIKNNYCIYGDLTISDDFVVNCTGEVNVKNNQITSLTNGLFRWGKVGTDFNCAYCDKLTSLKGAPESVGGSFDCCRCINLTSLEGAPKEVGKCFDCGRCDKLETLQGAPKKVGGNFWCDHCGELETLEGAPEKAGGDFVCSGCENLKSLEGAPAKINHNLCCWSCDSLNITMMDYNKYSINR